MKWMVASVSVLVSGNNQSTSGPMMRDVLLALKLAEEA
jgi:DNA polymerase III psi subunit